MAVQQGRLHGRAPAPCQQVLPRFTKTQQYLLSWDLIKTYLWISYSKSVLLDTPRFCTLHLQSDTFVLHLFVFLQIEKHGLIKAMSRMLFWVYWHLFDLTQPLRCYTINSKILSEIPDLRTSKDWCMCWNSPLRTEVVLNLRNYLSNSLPSLHLKDSPKLIFV